MNDLSTIPHPNDGADGDQGGGHGARYGRFVVQRLLGHGGMGVVFAARDPELDREVAIKVLRPGRLAADALQREAQAMARLSHPNTVTVFEVGRDHGQTFIAMELVAGTTLRAWLEEARPWREVLAMFVQAGRGLEAAHRANLVHRDFKPENVLVDGDGRPRVSDFGLVASAASAAESGGTPAYMAPEQWLGAGVDARADQFAFGVALWRALYGAPPFDGDTTEALRLAVLGGTPAEPPPTQVPRGVEAALRRAIARVPAARFPSLAALLAELDRALAPAPVRPRRAWLFPAIGGAALAGAVAIVVATQAGDPPPSTPSPPVAEHTPADAAAPRPEPVEAASAEPPELLVWIGSAASYSAAPAPPPPAPRKQEVVPKALLETQVDIGGVQVLTGEIDAAAAKAAFARATPAVRTCVDAARARGSRSGRAIVDIRIDDDGSVNPTSYDIADELLVPCLARVLDAVRLAPGHPGTIQLRIWFPTNR